jgi:hypothetical protein
MTTRTDSGTWALFRGEDGSKGITILSPTDHISFIIEAYPDAALSSWHHVSSDHSVETTDGYLTHKQRHGIELFIDRHLVDDDE